MSPASFLMGLICLGFTTGTGMGETASPAESREARAKICWLWEHFRDVPAPREKLEEWTILYPRLDREDLEACDELGAKILEEIRTGDPERYAFLSSAQTLAHEKRREKLRSVAVTQEESTDSRARICFLFDHFRTHPVAPGKLFSLEEMYERMLEGDRMAVDGHMEKGIREARGEGAAKAEELSAILGKMKAAVPGAKP